MSVRMTHPKLPGQPITVPELAVPHYGSADWEADDAEPAAAIQSQEASTIAALIRDGFVPESVVAAVRNNDWSLLKHSGLTSVQLLPPSSGQEPAPGAVPGADPGPAGPAPDAPTAADGQATEPETETEPKTEPKRRPTKE